MKVYISADIEGISTTTRAEDTRAAEADYPYHARQMTREVLAAIEGATEGIVAGPLTVLLFGLLGTLPFDPLFMGIFVAMGCCAVGCVVRSPLAGFKSGEKEGRHGH